MSRPSKSHPALLLPTWLVVVCHFAAALSPLASAQEYGEPDRDAPGDKAIQRYLGLEAQIIHEVQWQEAEGELTSAEEWADRRPRYLEEYYYMLGLWPLPEKNPLEVTVTGTIRRPDFVVEKLHYQSRPRLYVTANLYRPPSVGEGERLPAVLYVCGHSPRGRNGNKTAYQSHGIWFARHGIICLMLDTLQMGEIGAIHHGTYREGRWWWHSLGYTPAGVECWNGVRGIDYLVSRPDVDPERIAVTGISGGGAATFWIAAADERVRVAVPVSGMADLPSYVTNRVINGHCDCMFLTNTFQWPWTRIAGLIAPRPLLFVNSNADRIFPMDANERVILRLERLYALFGSGDLVDSVVSIGGHAYRRDIRQAAYRFIKSHLEGDARPITDSEVDLVTGSGRDRVHPIPPEDLRVFPEDSDLPADELNTTIDRHFVPRAEVALPEAGGFELWKATLLEELRRVTFRALPRKIPLALGVVIPMPGKQSFKSEEGLEVRLEGLRPAEGEPGRVVLVVASPADDPPEALPAGVSEQLEAGDIVYRLETRGTGESRWTRKNPPNYVERSLVLLGRTVDTGRVWDILAVAGTLAKRHDGVPVWLAGEGAAALLAAQAAVLDASIAGAIVVAPPPTFLSDDAPRFLNILRVCDVPAILGMLAPRPLHVRGLEPRALERVQAIYGAAGASPALTDHAKAQ